MEPSTIVPIIQSQLYESSPRISIQIYHWYYFKLLYTPSHNFHWHYLSSSSPLPTFFNNSVKQYTFVIHWTMWKDQSFSQSICKITSIKQLRLIIGDMYKKDCREYQPDEQKYPKKVVQWWQFPNYVCAKYLAVFQTSLNNPWKHGKNR